MSVFVLKIIALASMITDHSAYFLANRALLSWETYTLLRSIGRIAFPIYCFLLVNGFDKTSNRQHYLSRLMLFAVLSQLPFSLVFSPVNYIPSSTGGFSFQLGFAPLPYLLLTVCVLVCYLLLVKRDLSTLWLALLLVLGTVQLRFNGIVLLGGSLNVFYTLSFGLAAMAVIDGLIYQELPLVKALPRAVCLLLVILVLQPHADYAYKGLLLILALYACRRWRPAQLLAVALWCVLEYGAGSRIYLCFALLSLLPLLLYNGRKGPGLKLGFYALYPLHLLILGLVNLFL